MSSQGGLTMKRSSKIALLVSMFSLVSALTLGVGSASQSASTVPAKKARKPIYRSTVNPIIVVPVTVQTWDEKRAMFELAVKNFREDQLERVHQRCFHWK